MEEIRMKQKEKKTSESKKIVFFSEIFSFFFPFVVFALVKVKRNHHVYFIVNEIRNETTKQNTAHKQKENNNNDEPPASNSTNHEIYKSVFFYTFNCSFLTFFWLLSPFPSRSTFGFSDFSHFIDLKAPKSWFYLWLSDVVFFFASRCFVLFCVCEMYLSAMTINFSILLVCLVSSSLHAYILSRWNHVCDWFFFFFFFVSEANAYLRVVVIIVVVVVVVVFLSCSFCIVRDLQLDGQSNPSN